MAIKNTKEEQVEVSSRSTKDQILSAYQEVLKQLEEKESDKLEEGKKRKEEQKDF